MATIGEILKPVFLDAKNIQQVQLLPQPILESAQELAGLFHNIGDLQPHLPSAGGEKRLPVSAESFGSAQYAALPTSNPSLKSIREVFRTFDPTKTIGETIDAATKNWAEHQFIPTVAYEKDGRLIELRLFTDILSPIIAQLGLPALDNAIIQTEKSAREFDEGFIKPFAKIRRDGDEERMQPVELGILENALPQTFERLRTISEAEESIDEADTTTPASETGIEEAVAIIRTVLTSSLTSLIRKSNEEFQSVVPQMSETNLRKKTDYLQGKLSRIIKNATQFGRYRENIERNPAYGSVVDKTLKEHGMLLMSNIIGAYMNYAEMKLFSGETTANLKSEIYGGGNRGDDFVTKFLSPDEASGIPLETLKKRLQQFVAVSLIGAYLLEKQREGRTSDVNLTNIKQTLKNIAGDVLGEEQIERKNDIESVLNLIEARTGDFYKMLVPAQGNTMLFHNLHNYITKLSEALDERKEAVDAFTSVVSLASRNLLRMFIIASLSPTFTITDNILSRILANNLRVPVLTEEGRRTIDKGRLSRLAARTKTLVRSGIALLNQGSKIPYIFSQRTGQGANTGDSENMHRLVSELTQKRGAPLIISQSLSLATQHDHTIFEKRGEGDLLVREAETTLMGYTQTAPFPSDPTNNPFEITDTDTVNDADNFRVRIEASAPFENESLIRATDSLYGTIPVVITENEEQAKQKTTPILVSTLSENGNQLTLSFHATRTPFITKNEAFRTIRSILERSGTVENNRTFKIEIESPDDIREITYSPITGKLYFRLKVKITETYTENNETRIFTSIEHRNFSVSDFSFGDGGKKRLLITPIKTLTITTTPENKARDTQRLLSLIKTLHNGIHQVFEEFSFGEGEDYNALENEVRKFIRGERSDIDIGGAIKRIIRPQVRSKLRQLIGERNRGIDNETLNTYLDLLMSAFDTLTPSTIITTKQYRYPQQRVGTVYESTYGSVNLEGIQVQIEFPNPIVAIETSLRNPATVREAIDIANNGLPYTYMEFIREEGRNEIVGREILYTIPNMSSLATELYMSAPVVLFTTIETRESGETATSSEAPQPETAPPVGNEEANTVPETEETETLDQDTYATDEAEYMEGGTARMGDNTDVITSIREIPATEQDEELYFSVPLDGTTRIGVTKERPPQNAITIGGKDDRNPLSQQLAIANITLPLCRKNNFVPVTETPRAIFELTMVDERTKASIIRNIKSEGLDPGNETNLKQLVNLNATNYENEYTLRFGPPGSKRLLVRNDEKYLYALWLYLRALYAAKDMSTLYIDEIRTRVRDGNVPAVYASNGRVASVHLGNASGYINAIGLALFIKYMNNPEFERVVSERNLPLELEIDLKESDSFNQFVDYIKRNESNIYRALFIGDPTPEEMEQRAREEVGQLTRETEQSLRETVDVVRNAEETREETAGGTVSETTGEPTNETSQVPPSDERQPATPPTDTDEMVAFETRANFEAARAILQNIRARLREQTPRRPAQQDSAIPDEDLIMFDDVPRPRTESTRAQTPQTPQTPQAEQAPRPTPQGFTIPDEDLIMFDDMPRPRRESTRTQTPQTGQTPQTPQAEQPTRPAAQGFSIPEEDLIMFDDVPRPRRESARAQTQEETRAARTEIIVESPTERYTDEELRKQIAPEADTNNNIFIVLHSGPIDPPSDIDGKLQTITSRLHTIPEIGATSPQFVSVSGNAPGSDHAFMNAMSLNEKTVRITALATKSERPPQDSSQENRVLSLLRAVQGTAREKVKGIISRNKNIRIIQLESDSEERGKRYTERDRRMVDAVLNTRNPVNFGRTIIAIPIFKPRRPYAGANFVSGTLSTLIHAISKTAEVVREDGRPSLIVVTSREIQDDNTIEKIDKETILERLRTIENVNFTNIKSVITSMSIVREGRHYDTLPFVEALRDFFIERGLIAEDAIKIYVVSNSGVETIQPTIEQTQPQETEEQTQPQETNTEIEQEQADVEETQTEPQSTTQTDETPTEETETTPPPNENTTIQEVEIEREGSGNIKADDAIVKISSAISETRLGENEYLVLFSGPTQTTNIPLSTIQSILNGLETIATQDGVSNPQFIALTGNAPGGDQVFIQEMAQKGTTKQISVIVTPDEMTEDMPSGNVPIQILKLVDSPARTDRNITHSERDQLMIKTLFWGEKRRDFVTSPKERYGRTIVVIPFFLPRIVNPETGRFESSSLNNIMGIMREILAVQRGNRERTRNSVRFLTSEDIIQNPEIITLDANIIYERIRSGETLNSILRLLLTEGTLESGAVYKLEANREYNTVPFILALKRLFEEQRVIHGNEFKVVVIKRDGGIEEMR